MSKVISVELSTRGIKQLEDTLKERRKWLERKCAELASRLADMGAMKAEVGFAASYYDGDMDASVTVEQVGDAAFKVRASGECVLFVEFGTGLIGYGHPEPQGFGPGTYPGKGHWDDPNGWYYAHNQHSHGNPPNMPMYNTVKELEQELARVVREVFAT